ncbi:hypothetical protein [Anoxybacillus sp. LAT_26]|nr:hypothetical protein [Anoxybacillus sp. LAT_26]
MKERIHEYYHRLHFRVMAEQWSAMTRKTGTIDSNAHQTVQASVLQDH